MALRCSILGHTFDETEVRRDRRERGESEVVTVVTQVERCSRCGTERVVSENKEVVSVVDADEVGLDESGGTGGETEPGARTDPDAGGESEPEPGGSVPAGGDGGPGTAPPTDDGAETDSREGSESGTDPDPASDPDEEDVEFITETEGSLGGGEEVTEDVPSDAEGGIGGMAARSGAFDGSDETSSADETGESAREDAEILDAPDTERAPGQWPDEPDEDEPWKPDALDEDDEDQSADPAPDVEPVTEPSFTVPAGSLQCPDCGNEVSADSSFRAGDACPECQTGYLEAPEE